MDYLEFNRDDGSLDFYKNKIKGRLFGLLKEREKNGQWEKFLDTIVIELLGHKKEFNSIHYYALLGKVQSLRLLNFKYFRSTILECINFVEVAIQ